MKTTLAILSLAILFSCNGSKNESENNQDAAKEKAAEMTGGATNASASAEAKKYDIKSGIITFETKMSMSGIDIRNKNVLYFDDYGTKECQEEYKTENGKEILNTRSFVKDGFQYIISITEKSGLKTKARGTGVAAKFDMGEASTLKDNKYKELSAETVCGKSCAGFSMVTPSGNIKMYGWNRITLKTTLDASSMKSETIATKIEEDASIPADKFEVPADVKITDM